MAQRTIECTVTIQSSPQVVWDHLVDFERYEFWNPFIPQVTGRVEVGTPVDLYVALLRRRPFVQREWINLVQPGQTICWGTIMVHPIILTTNRWQMVRSPQSGVTQYINRLELSGALAPLVMFYYGDRLDRCFRLAASGLKTRCET